MPAHAQANQLRYHEYSRWPRTNRTVSTAYGLIRAMDKAGHSSGRTPAMYSASC